MRSPLLRLAHQAVEAALREEAAPLLAVDATAGNGHDACFLARCVGPRGRVLACDIQEAAIAASRVRLEAEGLADRVVLIQDGHEHLDRPLRDYGPVAAAMFNLGYLPGGDKTIVTRPENTLTALRLLLPRMARGSVVSLHLYTGHPGGPEETAAVREYAAALPAARWLTLESGMVNRRNGECLLLLYRQ